jgi:hypothetical protein
LIESWFRSEYAGLILIDNTRKSFLQMPQENMGEYEETLLSCVTSEASNSFPPQPACDPLLPACILPTIH